MQGHLSRKWKELQSLQTSAISESKRNSSAQQQPQNLRREKNSVIGFFFYVTGLLQKRSAQTNVVAVVDFVIFCYSNSHSNDCVYSILPNIINASQNERNLFKKIFDLTWPTMESCHAWMIENNCGAKYSNRCKAKNEFRSSRSGKKRETVDLIPTLFLNT